MKYETANTGERWRWRQWILEKVYAISIKFTNYYKYNFQLKFFDISINTFSVSWLIFFLNLSLSLIWMCVYLCAKIHWIFVLIKPLYIIWKKRTEEENWWILIQKITNFVEIFVCKSFKWEGTPNFYILTFTAAFRTKIKSKSKNERKPILPNVEGKMQKKGFYF